MTDTAFDRCQSPVELGRAVCGWATSTPAHDQRRMSVSFFRTTRSPFRPFGILEQTAFPSGGSGMAGTASGSVLTFLEAVQSGGAAAIADAARDVHGPRAGRGTSRGAGLGVGVTAAPYIVDARSGGHAAGAGNPGSGTAPTATSWFIDPANELTVVALSNTTFEGMTGRLPCATFANAVYGV